MQMLLCGTLRQLRHTGEDCDEDPRLESLPPNWEYFEAAGGNSRGEAERVEIPLRTVVFRHHQTRKLANVRFSPKIMIPS
jgi:hypothetical protein